MSVGRRKIEAPPVTWPFNSQAAATLRGWLLKLWEGYYGHPAPHAITHLQGEADPLQAPGAPAAVVLNQSPAAGSGPSYALEDHVHENDILLTARGDLITRTSSAYAPLAVGSDDDVLTADSGEPTGLKWAPNAALAAAEEALYLAFVARGCR